MRHMLRASLFVWQNGCEWKDHPAPEDQKMVVYGRVIPDELSFRYLPCLIGNRGERRMYDPFREEPDMFLRLASCSPTPDGIQKFALRFGGIGPHHYRRPAGWQREHGRLLEWQHAILNMKYLVDLWQACSSRDAEQLRQFVSWRGKKLQRRRRGDDPYELFISRELESFEKHRDEREAEFYKAGDHYKPARDMLFRRVNGALEVLTFQAAVANESLELKVTAESLYTIALSQFALAVVERWEVKYCQRCGLPFSEAESRIDRAFCSDSCRVLACRDRKKRAIELHTRGKDVRSIVEEVGSDLKTVKNWLKIKESHDDAKKKRKR